MALFSFAWSALGEGLDLKKWKALAAIADQRRAETSHQYVPEHMQAVTSRQALVQQLVDHQVKLATTASGSPFKVLDTRWEGNIGNAVADNSTQASFQMHALDTKAALNFENVITASMGYKPLHHEAEIRLAPNGKILGMGLALSHTITPDDQRSRLVVKYEW